MDKQYFRELEFGAKEKILSDEQKNQFIAELQDKLRRRNMQIKELKQFKNDIRKSFMNTMLTPQEFIGEVEKLLNR